MGGYSREMYRKSPGVRKITNERFSARGYKKKTNNGRCRFLGTEGLSGRKSCGWLPPRPWVIGDPLWHNTGGIQGIRPLLLKGYGQIDLWYGFCNFNSLIRVIGDPLWHHTGGESTVGGTEGLWAESHVGVVAHKWLSDWGSPMTSYWGDAGLGVLKGYGQKVMWGWWLTNDWVIEDPLWPHTGGDAGLWGYWRVMGKKSRGGGCLQVIEWSGIPYDIILGGIQGWGVLKGYGQKVMWGWLLTNDWVIEDPLWYHTGGIQGRGYWRVMGRKSRMGSCSQVMFFTSVLTRYRWPHLVLWIEKLKWSWQYRHPRIVESLWKSLIITRMHSSRMRTARSSSRPGGVSTRPPQEQTPSRGSTPRRKQPPGGSTPKEAAPPINRMTDACEHITLPQLRCGR